MTRARAGSIPQVSRLGQCSLNRHLRRWLAKQLRQLKSQIQVSAAECRAEHYRKHFHSYSHACLLLFHGLSGGASLRQSYDAFATCPGLVTLAGLASAEDDERLNISFSQFAASNTSRPAAFLADLIPELLAAVRQGGELSDALFPVDLHLLDSTFIKLSIKVAPWLRRTTRSCTKSGVRVQVQYAPAWDLPEHVVVTTDANDYRGLDLVVLDDPTRLAALDGQTLVIDLGYYSHTRLARLSAANVHWVTRRLPAASMSFEEDCPLQGLLPGIGKERITVQSDQRVTVGSSNNRKGAVLHDVRLVTARVEPLPKAARLGAKPVTYELLTDRWDLTALEVVQVYLWRWQIELFFRWLKSHIRLSRLLGHSENAVVLSVALAIVVHLLTILAARSLGLSRRSPGLLRRLAWVLAKISPSDVPAELEPPRQLDFGWFAQAPPD